MTELFSLGEMYVSDFLLPDQAPRHPKISMDLVMDHRGTMKLNQTAPKETMWGKYWYRSSINLTMRNELKSIVSSILPITNLKENDLWIDIACNDGCLLSNIPKNLIRIGVDPADDSYRLESEQHANLIIQDYFTKETFWSSRYGSLKAKVITCIAMFYDLENPDQFLEDVSQVIDDKGLLVLQLSYTPLMIKQLAFDNIVAEHMYYYSLFNLRKLLNNHGFTVVDCQLNDTNGGSFRVYATKSPDTFASQTHRDVCSFRINSLLEYEKILELDNPKTWEVFHTRIKELKDQVSDFIIKERSRGKTIYGYGASTKGNTLLQYFNLDHMLITAIAERSTYKWGLKTVGTEIPIISEEEMRKAKPDYLLILPWHFQSEFRERERDLLSTGTKFIIPCPKFEVV